MGRLPWARRCWAGLLVGGLLTPVPAAHAQSPLPTQAPPVCGAPAPPASSVAPPAAGFVSISPVRVLDTRNGTGVAAGRVEAGCTVTLDLAASPVPANASGVALSVTATEAAEPGYVTVFPCASGQPYASNLNPRAGDPTPNLVLVPIDPAARQVCLFTLNPTHLVADLTGWFAPGGGRLHPVTPARLLDTRVPHAPPGTTPAPDGSRPAAGIVVELPVAGAGIVPPGAAAVAVNVTVDQTAAAGYVTAFPCGTAPPLASNVNYLARDTRSTQALVGLGAGGRLCLFTFAGAHLIVDVTAWFEAPGPAGQQAQPFYGEFSPVVAERLLDTRDGTGGLPGAFAGGEQRAWTPLATGRVPRGASAIVVNVTATQAAAPGYVRLAPCDDPASAVSSVNVVPGVDATNVAVVPLPFDGRVCVFSYAGTHVIVDLLGAFTLPALFSELSVTGPIWPTLDPDEHDYAVQCSAGTNTLPARVVPAPGVATRIDSRTPEGVVDGGGTGGYGRAERTAALAEDDALVVTLTPASGPADEYWFRCLPHDFPALDVSITGSPAPGYYLLDSGVQVGPGGAGTFAIILDERGVPVWYRRVNPAVINVHVDSEGHLVWGQFGTPGFNTDLSLGYEVRELDGTFVKLWRTGNSVPTGYHDIVELPDGDQLMIGYKVRPGPTNLTALGIDENGQPLGASERVVDSIVQRVRPDGSVAWEWNSVAIPDAESTVPMRFVFGNGSPCPPPDGCIDLVHVNSLDLTPTGDVLASARNLDALLILHPDGAGGADVVQKWGGIDSDVTFNDPPYTNGFGRQHDAHILPNGNLLVFDNRTPGVNTPLVPPGKPRAVEYRIDGTVLTRVAERDVPGNGVSFGLGSARRLADGGLVVGWGGIANPAFAEYSPDGVERLQVSIGGGRLPYRVVKEPPATFDLAELRATAGRD